MMHSGRAEISPSTTLSDNGPASAVGAGAQGKKKFAHFRRLFSSLHKKNHDRDGSEGPHNVPSGKHNHHNLFHTTSSGASSTNNSLSSLHLPHFHHSGFLKQHHNEEDSGHDGSSVRQRLRVPPTSSTVILRRPSTASSESTANDENAPVISDRYKGYILETYGTPVRTIGQGTGGYVKLHQACDGRYYAVKTFTFPDANNRSQMTSTQMNVRQWKHLLDEASFSLSLRHPNVIRTYQFVREDDGTVYSIMEYCEKDLFTVVQDGSLTPEDIDRLFFQLLSGIAYLHDSARVAHRDMKLDNLCVDEEGNLKIIDFGCSSTFDPMAPTQTRGICGSDPYIAPEVFVPRAQYDPRKVDIWALGIIYLAMVSGHFPWEVAKAHDPNYSLYLKYHGRVIDHWLPKTKPANAVIKSMLEIDPTDRPTIDAIMKDSWIAGLHERYGHSSTIAAINTTSLSKTSTLAASPVDIKAVNEALATSRIYGNSHVGYSPTSTVSSGLSISSGY
ncbi:serine/threonine protein kinase [Coemansia sp. RSA 2399]|nr:serine/threonine protein kinase [Coemansia sp. RSA 2399]KAJ1904554.1 serine/threonine protein kinase [Coemansia sp. IMI 209127]